MTTTEIFEHPKYQDSSFYFKGEKWTAINKDGFSRYKMSNFYRVKNNKTGHILKPISRRSSNKYEVSLYNDEGKVVKFHMEKLFGAFEVYTEKRRRGNGEFIYNAF